MNTLVLLALLQFAAAENTVEPAHFHHVHMNVSSVRETMQYYERVFSAVPIKYNGAADALFTERSFILFNEVESPRATPDTAIWHTGWGGMDVQAMYNWWKDRGITFSVPLTPLPGKDNYYMYFEGPDKETVEVNTTGHTRFGHVHLFATDVNKTCAWYEDHLGLKSRRGTSTTPPAGDPNTLAGIWMNFIQCDNVNIIVFGAPRNDPPPTWWNAPPLTAFKSTTGHVFDHLAFSYRDLAPVYERMKSNGVEILQEPETDPAHGFKCFSVQGPDNVVIEILEAPPLPDAMWEK